MTETMTKTVTEGRIAEEWAQIVKEHPEAARHLEWCRAEHNEWRRDNDESELSQIAFLRPFVELEILHLLVGIATDAGPIKPWSCYRSPVSYGIDMLVFTGQLNSESWKS